MAPQYRGGERQTELLVKALAELGFQQRLVVKRGSPLIERCKSIRQLDIREVAANPFAAAVAARGSSITHAHEGRTVYSALMANLFFGIPYVITRRVVAPQSNKYIRRLAYRRSQKMVAISHAVVDSLRIRFAEVDPAIIPDAVANFSVNPDAVEKIRADRAGKLLMGHVGALDLSHKGQLTLVECAQNAEKNHPNWHFMLCGSGQDEAQLRASIGSLRNVELVGWVDNVGDYLASFDIFVYPSLHEAMGSALLDAMQAGLPIVASRVGGIPEFVEEGVNGVLVDVGSAEQIVAGIAAISGDPDSLAQMRASNKTKAEDYSPGRMAQAYLRAYSRQE